MLCGSRRWGRVVRRIVWFFLEDICCFFFFQAEDGIRDLTVTGVQTCALPISLGGEGSSPTPPNLVFLSILLPARHRRTLLLQLGNVPDGSRTIFPLPSRLAALQERRFSKNHGW